MTELAKFDHVWLVDFEFSAPDGDLPDPVCMVVTDWRNGETLRLWQTELRDRTQAPIDLGPDSLFIAYFAAAEFGCLLQLGWDPPVNTVDLYAEFRNLTNGLAVPAGNGLLGALAFFGLPFMDAVEKDAMRALALRGGPWALEERKMLLDYCETDVHALRRLLDAMADGIDVERALLRGRYMWSVARMERTGVPVDVRLLRSLRENWSRIQDGIVHELDERYGTYDGISFRSAKFREWLSTAGIGWPEDERGRLLLRDEIFEEQALRHPELAPLRAGRQALAQLRPADLAVGKDGRNRAMLSPFGSKTGRNQPRSSRFVFGAPSWFRRVIQAAEGRSLAYLDWSQQEFGVAAALSEDDAMVAAYQSGDPYLAFARQAGAVPTNATKETHSAQRELFKRCALGVIYGMSAFGLAAKIGQPIEAARQLLRAHQTTFPRYWEWSDAMVCCTRLNGRLLTTFGWQLNVTETTNDRTLLNFPMQANGAEMLRFAIMFTHGRGVTICAPVHDALLIEAPTVEMERSVADARDAMADASALVLGGFRLRTEAEVVHGPRRFPAKDPARIWDLIARILDSESVAL